jgi:hypothetical protein
MQKQQRSLTCVCGMQGCCWYFGELWNEEAGTEAQMLQRIAEGGQRRRYRPMLPWLLKQRDIAEPQEDIQGERLCVVASKGRCWVHAAGYKDYLREEKRAPCTCICSTGVTEMPQGLQRRARVTGLSPSQQCLPGQ